VRLQDIRQAMAGASIKAKTPRGFWQEQSKARQKP